MTNPVADGSVLAVILDVGLSPQFIRELFFRARRHGLIVFDLRNARLGFRGDVFFGRLLVVG